MHIEFWWFISTKERHIWLRLYLKYIGLQFHVAIDSVVNCRNCQAGITAVKLANSHIHFFIPNSTFLLHLLLK